MGKLILNNKPDLEALVSEYRKANEPREDLSWPHWLKDVLGGAVLAHRKGFRFLEEYVRRVYDDMKHEHDIGRVDDTSFVLSVTLLDSIWGGWFKQYDLFLCKLYSDQRMCSKCAKAKSCSDLTVWLHSAPGDSESDRKARMDSFLRIFVSSYDKQAYNILWGKGK